MTDKKIMHVISGTHWDREWRQTAEQSKVRLADLLDLTIDVLEKNNDYKCFCIDGGTVVIEDYLTIRPENEERIKKLVKEKKLQILKWYTLPEMFTVAAESLVRNLLVGSKMAKELGGAIESGYTATSYGQTSQLPQIYNGFGINTAMFYRGTNRYALPPVFVWEGADGSQLTTLKTYDIVTRQNWFYYVHQPLVLDKPVRNLDYYFDRKNAPVHLCDEGLYERAFNLLHESFEFKKDKESLEKALENIVEQSTPFAIGKHLLALNMEDNDQPYAPLSEMVSAMNGVSEDVDIIQNSLDEYFKEIFKEIEGQQLYLHKGEVRFPAVEVGFNALFGATHSSRVKLKILNEKAETNLIYLAEPISAIASLYGNRYPATNLDRAWKSLLKNHAHDSICGAAVEQAHEDMLYGFSVANTVAEELASRGLISIYSNINTASKFDKNSDHIVTVFNTMNFSRNEIVPLVLDIPKGSDVAETGIGFGAGNITSYFDIIDQDGREVKFELISAEEIKIGVERELDTKAVTFPAIRRRILLHSEVPALGYSSYAIRFRGPKYVKNPEIGPNRQLIARPNGVLENEFIKVIINSNGTFTLVHKESGRIMENMHYFTDSGETGVAHISKRTKRDFMITSLGSSSRISMYESNTMRGIYKIELDMEIPSEATFDARDRLKDNKKFGITTWLTLNKGEKFLRVRTIVDNNSKDHKLCVNFPSGIYSDFAYAESAFAIEKRSIKWTQNGDNMEQFFPFQPMQNFVDINDDKNGLAILNKGLREYEVMDDEARTIAITLIRTHRAYMTATSDMNPNELDKFRGIHSLGQEEFKYAIYPHKGDWQEGNVIREAYSHKVDIKAIQGVPIEGHLPCTDSLFTITPSDKIMLTAFKAAEDGDGTVVRLWNTTSETQKVSLNTKLPFGSYSFIKIDESKTSEMIDIKGSIDFEMSPNKLATILFK